MLGLGQVRAISPSIINHARRPIVITDCGSRLLPASMCAEVALLGMVLHASHELGRLSVSQKH
jgi:hypothetical protein